MRLNYKVILSLFSLLLIVVIIFINLKSPLQLSSREVIKLTDKDCNINSQPCYIETSALNVFIDFDKNIFYLKPFGVSITTEIANVESIRLNFKMKGMSMGLSHFILKKEKSENNKLKWNAIVLLPICVTGRADWLVDIELSTKNKNYILTLPILVEKYKS